MLAFRSISPIELSALEAAAEALPSLLGLPFSLYVPVLFSLFFNL
jgi:hypothetical protein